MFHQGFAGFSPIRPAVVSGSQGQMERAAPKGGPVIGSAWTTLLDQRLAVLGVTHRKLAAHAARSQKTRALGQHILGAVAQFREEREDLFLGAVADGFQRFLA